MKKMLAMGLALMMLFAMAITANAESQQKELSFTPGTYTSVQPGHNDDLTVEVTFSENAITDVQMTNHKETERLGDAAIDAIRDTIVPLQTLDVDVVSGSTVTYGAIMRGVRDCVKQAGADPADFGPNPTPVQPDSEEEAQIVIVGAGASGLSAALEAANLGATDILVVEKLATVGGSSGHSSGVILCPTEEGDDSFDTEKFYQLHLDVSKTEPKLARAIADIALDDVHWLAELGVPLNENRPEAHGYTVRTLSPEPNGGIVRPFGMKIINGLYDAVVASGVVDIQTRTRATELLTENGKTVGIVAERQDGSKLTVKADAVILASGGYNLSDKMKELEPHTATMRHVSACGNVGDGIFMAEDIGAKTYFSDSIRLVGANSIGMNKYGLPTNYVEVNGDGVRLMPEGCHYKVEMNAIYASENPNVWRLFDSNNDIEMLEKQVKKGLVKKADTIEELAEMLDINLETLNKTLAVYNENTGKEDPEFGKDASLMLGFGQAPFYGIRVVPEVLQSFGGLCINEKAEVLDTNDQPMPNLYAVGECANAMFFINGYSYSGGAVQFAVASGRIAARSVMEDIIK